MTIQASRADADGAEVLSPNDPAPAASTRVKRIPGEEGLWVFLLGDMTIFAVFFATILYERGTDPVLFRDSQAVLHADYAVVNTCLLLLGSLLVVRGVQRVRDGAGGAPVLFALTVVCAVGFAVIKAYEYYTLVQDGYDPMTNEFFTYYFAFTGIHLFHLVIGALLLVWLSVSTRKVPATKGQVKLVEVGACYWHMVDGLWLLLFPLLYLVR